MDNDLMARRLRPPSEPSKPSATSSLPFTPVPSALPWETEPPAAASRDDIPWDTPAAEAWPPVPAADEPAEAMWAATATPEAFEAAPAASDSAQTDSAQTDSAPVAFEPAALEPTSPSAPTNESVVWPPVTDARATDALAFDVPVADTMDDAAAAEMAAPAEVAAAAAETVATVETDTAAVASPSAAPEAPWDRPADDDFDQPMDARVDGPSWDEPSFFADFDDSGFFDDRPPDMLEAFHSPAAVAVAVEERPAEEHTVEAVASTFVEAPPESDAAFVDPYDETAPVVADVTERAQIPQWPSWNGHDTAEPVNDSPAAELSAVAEVETETPVQSAWMPWDETAPEDPPQFEAEPTSAFVMPETEPGSVGPTSPDDLFALPPVTEDELPEPDEVAPWDFVADDDAPDLFENSVAEVATVGFEPMVEVEAEPVADVEATTEATVDAEPTIENEPEPEADSFEAWLAMAVAGGIADVQVEPEAAAETDAEGAPADSEAEPEMTAEAAVEGDFEAAVEADADVEGETSSESEVTAAAEPEADELDAAESEAVEDEVAGEPVFEAEAETEAAAEDAEAAAEDAAAEDAEAEPESVEMQVPVPSAFPATIYASGPESGLPANVVLRIELSIVDDAKRLNVTNVASASEFAPRVEDALADKSPEPAAAALVDDSAWPAIWDPDRPTAGFATPAAVAANPTDAWAWTDPTPEQAPYELSAPTDTWPEVDRPNDAFGQSSEMADAVPFAPLAVTDESATASADQAASPRISTIAEPQSDLWFLSAEPKTATDEAAVETTADKAGMSLLTVGLTIGMAVLVIVLVLVFIQLMTSLLG